MGLVDVKLWGSVLISAASLIPTPIPAFATCPPRQGTAVQTSAQHRCSEARASPGPLLEGPGAGAVSASLDSSISDAGRASKGTCRKKVHLALSLSRGEYARLSVPSLGH